MCRKCGMYNHHRSVQCPGTQRHTVVSPPAQPRYTPPAQPRYTPQVTPATSVRNFQVPNSMRFASIVVTQGDNVLLQGRGASVRHPHTIATPGGAVDVGETALNAALRELKEESGLVLNASNYSMLDCVYKHVKKNGRDIEAIAFIVHYYGPMTWSNGSHAWECENISNSVVLGTQASTGHKWVSKQALSQLIGSRVFLNDARPACRKAVQLLG